MKELAVRFALGGTLWQVLRPLAGMCFMLVILGGILGVALAWGIVQALVLVGFQDIPRGDTINFDLWVLVWALSPWLPLWPSSLHWDLPPPSLPCSAV